MRTTLSAPMRRAMHAQQTGEAVIVLLTLSHALLPEPIRVTSNGEDVTSEGQLYLRFPFDITLPPESDDAPPQVQLRIDAVDQRIVTSIRELQGAPTVQIALALASSPDVLETRPYAFTLREAEYDAGEITGTLMYEPVLDEPYPGWQFSPSTTPGVFA